MELKTPLSHPRWGLRPLRGHTTPEPAVSPAKCCIIDPANKNPLRTTGNHCNSWCFNCPPGVNKAILILIWHEITHDTDVRPRCNPVLFPICSNTKFSAMETKWRKSKSLCLLSTITSIRQHADCSSNVFLEAKIRRIFLITLAKTFNMKCKYLSFKCSAEFHDVRRGNVTSLISSVGPL